MLSHTILAASLGLAASLVLSRLVVGGAFRRRLLIVGGGPDAARLIDAVGSRAHSRYQIIGVVSEPSPRPTAAAVTPWIGPIARLDRLIAATKPTAIAIAMAGSARAAMRLAAGQLLDARLHGVEVEEATSLLERVTGKIAIEALTPDSLVRSEGFRHVEAGRVDLSSLVARALSFVCAFVSLLALAPLLALIALAIRIDSPGPVLFVQRRVGRGGAAFDLWKFRTMHHRTVETSEWVSDNVHRITRVGHWLRRFRLDEFPQFVNVLRGEMNIVGPRPHPATNYPLFLDRIPFYAARTAIRPGITGWAQVRYGYANGLEEETEKMRYDLYYVKHRSLLFDLRILAETVVVVCFDRTGHEAAADRGQAARGVRPARREPDATNVA